MYHMYKINLMICNCHSTLAFAEEKGSQKVYLKLTIDVHNVSKAISRKLKD